MVEFDIKRSTKAYINSSEHYIITECGVVYLRVVGAEGNYVVMTATAGEEFAGDVACPDMISLNLAALRTSKTFGLKPIVKQDYHGREYVEICRCEFISDAFRAAERLFKIYEECSSDWTKNELFEVYANLTMDNLGADIYLSNGMWLSSDGSISVRGRSS
jgi:hypothetical protein